MGKHAINPHVDPDRRGQGISLQPQLKRGGRRDQRGEIHVSRTAGVCGCDDEGEFRDVLEVGVCVV